jgi:hypothetical protein
MQEVTRAQWSCMRHECVSFCSGACHRDCRHILNVIGEPSVFSGFAWDMIVNSLLVCSCAWVRVCRHIQNDRFGSECPSVFSGVACDMIVHCLFQVIAFVFVCSASVFSLLPLVRVLAFGIVAISSIAVLRFGCPSVCCGVACDMVEHQSVEFEWPSVFSGVACDVVVQYVVWVLACGFGSTSGIIVSSLSVHPCSVELHATCLFVACFSCLPW